jgi:hypothetical protein
MKGFKDSTRMKYMDEGISSRPTTDSGRRMTNEELGMTPGGVDPVSKPKAKPVGPAPVAVAKVLSGMARKALPAKVMNSDREVGMVRRKTGGLMAMPKGKCK